MRNNYTWWLDSREKNKKFLQYQVDEEWRYEAIRASKIFILDEGDEDADIADFTNNLRRYMDIHADLADEPRVHAKRHVKSDGNYNYLSRPDWLGT